LPQSGYTLTGRKHYPHAKEGESNIKTLVIGLGKVGAASAWALVKDSEMEKEERT